MGEFGEGGGDAEGRGGVVGGDFGDGVAGGVGGCLPGGDAKGGGGGLNGGKVVSLDVDLRGHNTAAAFVARSVQRIKNELGLGSGLCGEPVSSGKQRGKGWLQRQAVHALFLRACRHIKFVQGDDVGAA